MTFHSPTLRRWNNWSASFPKCGWAFLGALSTHLCMEKKFCGYRCIVLQISLGALNLKWPWQRPEIQWFGGMTTRCWGALRQLLREAGPVDAVGGGGEKEVSWKELWGMEAYGTNFLIRLGYDVHLTAANLNHIEKSPHAYCVHHQPAWSHIYRLVASLAQGRYTWLHKQLLRCLAAIQETKKTATNALPPSPPKPKPAIAFIKAGTASHRARGSKPYRGQLRGAQDWKLLVQCLCFP